MRSWLAEDIMNPDVLTVPRGMPVHELAMFLTENEISGAPVVDLRGRPLGVVSVTDIASVDREVEPESLRENARGFYGRASESRFNAEDIRGLRVEESASTVEDIMTPTVISVTRDTPVSQIARIMLKDHIHRVIVLDADRLAGIVTTFDMLRLLTDEEADEVLVHVG